MLTLNPLLKTFTPLPASQHASFLASFPSTDTGTPSFPPPTSTYPLHLFSVTEGTTAGGADGGSGWRGGWAKRFVPEEITYDTSYHGEERGAISLTKAQMGVRNVTRWRVREGEGEGGEKGWLLDVTGEVTSNRMLMTFIKTTIQESYGKLGRDFVALLERERAKAEGTSEEGEGEGPVEGEGKPVGA